MKKVININFSGRLINIEEDAYVQLQSYIESLKKYFSNEQGQEEIIADIENRIAEIFSDKQRKGAASINEADVAEVISIIGKPEDFGPIDEDQNTTHTNSNQSQTKQFVTRSKLYRDGNDKMLGGVCSGVAAFFNIDTVLVRVIFAVLLFGAGIGFLLYIILWIVVPESKNVQPSMQKRLFRDTDDKMFGGVSSGLSKYFGIDIWIPRLIFAAPFVFAVLKSVSSIAYHNVFNDNRFWSFGFGGTTTVIYFLLWWIIPEAKTTQEKMAMKGEKLDLESIKNNVQDGIRSFTEKANTWSKEVTNKSTQFANNINQNVKTNSMFKDTSSKIGQGFGLLIKGFLLFIGGIIAFSLLMAFIGMVIGGAGFWPLKNFILESGSQTTYFWGSLLLLIVPGIMFLTWIARRIFKLKNNIRPVKIILGSLFFIGVISAMLLAGSLVRSFQFNNNAKPDNEISITQPTDKLMVTVNEPEVTYSGELPWVHIDDDGFDITKDTLKYANIKIRIEKSRDSAYHTLVKKYSNGSSTSDAEERAQKANFKITQIGNTLDLGSHIDISKYEKFRGQQILVTIQVPVGRKIQFDETVDKLHPFNVRVSESWENGRRKYRKRQRIYYEDAEFNYNINEPYKMNEDGKLELVNKPKEEINNNNDKDEQIEERKKEIEELKKQKILDSLDMEKEKIERKKEKAEQGPTTFNNTGNANDLISIKARLAFAYLNCLI